MRVIFWHSLLFCTLILFLLGLKTNEMVYYLLALLLGIVIRIVGYDQIIHQKQPKMTKLHRRKG